jgi:hypothetical protein
MAEYFEWKADEREKNFKRTGDKVWFNICENTQYFCILLTECIYNFDTIFTSNFYLNGVNEFIVITGTRCVLFEVGNEFFLNVTYMRYVLHGDKHIFVSTLTVSWFTTVQCHSVCKVWCQSRNSCFGTPVCNAILSWQGLPLATERTLQVKLHSFNFNGTRSDYWTFCFRQTHRKIDVTVKQWTGTSYKWLLGRWFIFDSHQRKKYFFALSLALLSALFVCQLLRAACPSVTGWNVSIHSYLQVPGLECLCPRTLDAK